MTGKSSKTTDFFRKVGDAVLGANKLPKKLKVKAARLKRKTVPKKPQIPKIFQGYFERRHAGWPEYAMFKMQLAFVILVLVAVVYSIFFPVESVIPLSLMLAFSAYLLHLAFVQFRQAFKQDYSAYRSFVIMCLAIVWIFIIVARVLMPAFNLTSSFSPESVYLSSVAVLGMLGMVIGLYSVFRFKYGRNFTYGTVDDVMGKRAVVRVSYDICSNVKAGLYTAESFVKVKKGDRVKLSVERPLLGLRGSKVRAVIGKAADPRK
ncbi:MAG: DUF2101 family protein [Candidatus Hadarchaeota archaeon]